MDRYLPSDDAYITRKLHSIRPAEIALWLIERPGWSGSLAEAVEQFVGVTEFDLDDKRIYLAEGSQEVIASPPGWIDMVDDALGYPEKASQQQMLIVLVNYMDKYR